MPERLEVELVRRLEAAYAIGSAVEVVEHASPYQWGNACHDLFEAGRLDVLKSAVRYLQPKYPGLTYLESLSALLDAMPHGGSALLAFCDDPTAEVEVLQRPDCDTVLIGFCACRGTLGLPLNFVHQWLGCLPVSIIYLKDLRELWGGCGFPELGPDRAAAVAQLTKIVREIGGRRIYTFGVSHGGFPALHYGLELGATGVLALAAATDLTPSFVGSLGPLRQEYINLRRLAPDYVINLRDRYQSARHKPHALVAYSANHPTDRRQAARMAGLPNVELVAIDHAQHNVIEPLIRKRQLMPLLERLVRSGRAEQNRGGAVRDGAAAPARQHEDAELQF